MYMSTQTAYITLLTFTMLQHKALCTISACTISHCNKCSTKITVLVCTHVLERKHSKSAESKDFSTLYQIATQRLAHRWSKFPNQHCAHEGRAASPITASIQTCNNHNQGKGRHSFAVCTSNAQLFKKWHSHRTSPDYN